MNKVFLIGNLVKDPELRYTPNNKAVTSLRIAHNEKYGEKEKAIYADIIVWGKTAEHCCKYLAKGSEILVEGRLDYRQWEKDGNFQSKHEVIAEKITFMRKPRSNNEPTPPAMPPVDAPDDDIPF